MCEADLERLRAENERSMRALRDAEIAVEEALSEAQRLRANEADLRRAVAEGAAEIERLLTIERNLSAALGTERENKDQMTIDLETARINRLRIEGALSHAKIQLQECHAREAQLKESRAEGHVYYDSRWFNWGLYKFTFPDNFNTPIDNIVWPKDSRGPAPQDITFGKKFNQPIDRVQWPSGLTTIYFGENFNQPIDRVQWPRGLKNITVSHSFNQPINGVHFPRDVIVVKLSSSGGGVRLWPTW